MTYRSKWKDFIQRELITGSFKTELELKEYYEKSFEQNQPVIKELIENELSRLLQGEFTLTIQKDSIIVDYSKLKPYEKIFVMPCNYYGCQIDHEFIYGSPDEVVPYIIYFILQKNAIKFAQLGLYYIPPKRKKNFEYENIIVKETLEDCYKELFSNIATAWPHLDKSKKVADISAELDAMLTFPPVFLNWEDEERKKERFEIFFKHSLEHDFTSIVKIQKL
jgi:hypothetical protein|uniref:Uncharacterized protein n=1 Tax=Siphoviridae sp. ctHip2 TaxID=2827830 RepID=A0A8S5RVM1_9CAUD|nr:MAG TPA: hypothetical protein [Siphoviridae sp. ctHip2]